MTPLGAHRKRENLFTTPTRLSTCHCWEHRWKRSESNMEPKTTHMGMASQYVQLYSVQVITQLT